MRLLNTSYGTMHDQNNLVEARETQGAEKVYHCVPCENM